MQHVYVYEQIIYRKQHVSGLETEENVFNATCTEVMDIEIIFLNYSA